MTSSHIKAWIQAARLRTLPLALAGLALGNILAAAWGHFTWNIACFSILTAVLLQILSNYANDYGDFKNGADNENRIGPTRAVQSGLIAEKTMLKAIIALGILSFLSGVLLLYFASANVQIIPLLILLACGLSAIAAAVKYTATKNPYGYKGWGDLAVFLFFGLFSVLGGFYLQSGKFMPTLLFPAAAFGFLATGVLNLNNMRDIENDRESGKNTIAVRLGLSKARYYHLFLLALSLTFYTFFLILFIKVSKQYLFLTPLIILLVIHARQVMKASTYEAFNPLLKQLALGSAASSIIYALAFILY